jgi:hypothetical protein
MVNDMNASQRRLCLSITHSLQAHPASAPFRGPVDLIEFPNYSEVVDDPMDLATVERRLHDRDYRSVREWKRDLRLIWDNALAYAGHQSFVAVLVHHLERVVEKELRAMSATTLTGWLARVSELRSNFNDIATSAPTPIRDSCPLEMLPHGELAPFTPEDYNFVFAAITGLPAQGDRDALKKMLKKPKDVFSLMALPLTLLHKAMNFVKEKTPKITRAAMDRRGITAPVDLPI